MLKREKKTQIPLGLEWLRKPEENGNSTNNKSETISDGS